MKTRLIKYQLLEEKSQKLKEVEGCKREKNYSLRATKREPEEMLNNLAKKLIFLFIFL